MVIKCPPPMPILCAFITELHKPVAIAASTAEPSLASIFLPTVEQYALSAATANLVYFPRGCDSSVW